MSHVRRLSDKWRECRSERRKRGSERVQLRSRTEQKRAKENKAFLLLYSLLIRCHYKAHMRKCQCACVVVRGVCICEGEIKSVCTWEREREKRETMREQEHRGRASVVADMITFLDLSYGKNKTSISHYLPFNQIPTFFASPPQNCHRLKISPFLIKEPRVQLISRLGEFLFRNFEAKQKR